MPFNIADVKQAKVSFSKNLISTQTETGLSNVLGTNVFDATYGWGTTSTSSTVIWAAHACGFADSRITVTMRWRTGAAPYFGPFLRMGTYENATYQNYYMARYSTGSCRISKISGGSVTNLVSAGAAWNLSADVDVTITFAIIGNSLTADFVASGYTTYNLSTTDSSFTAAGFTGVRSVSTQTYSSSVLVEQI